MKIKFDGYEIEIKAKFEGEKRYSEYSAMSLLNRIALRYCELAESLEAEGSTAIAKGLKNVYNDITDTLQEKGFYD